MKEEEFFDELTQEILARSGAEETFTRTAFLDHMCGKLEEEAFITGYDLTEHKISSKGQAVDAWSYDEELSRLTLMLGDYRSSGELESLTNGEIKKLFKRLRNFVQASLKSGFAESLEESDPVAGLSWLISEYRDDIESVNLVLLSNASLSAKVAELPEEKIDHYKTSYDIWDFGRMFRMEASGKSRDDVEIDFEDFTDDGIPCLPAYTGDDSLHSYLLVMPGEVLAELYGNYGERLLEQNVRTFLQFRGKINKGIRNTIVNEPEMFFSYNNGLSATAEDVVTDDGDGRLLKATNLQIVNGGQTTASIFTAWKKEKADLSKVYVQIKLSVIDPEKVESIVPRISEYSNTQNKVNAADFFSNHPFHMRFEEFSRRLWAPSPEGGLQETHWFYERARGQFANQQAPLTNAQKKKFLAQNPRSQMVTKTDLAKFILSFEERPHEVSLGAQKAFAGSTRNPGFVGMIAKEWDKDNRSFNELWFKRAIAKAIFFREVDRHVFKQPWYGGYKANIVTYTLAKFAAMVRIAGRDLDFLQIWERQKLPVPILDQLGEIAEEVNEILTNPPEGMTSNVSEWAKKPDCWEAVEEVPMNLNPSIKSLFIDAEEKKHREKEGARTQVIQDSIHAQSEVFEKGAVYWKKLRDWNRTTKKLTAKEMGILNVACSIPNKIPTDKQAAVLVRAEKRARDEGFFFAG